MTHPSLLLLKRRSLRFSVPYVPLLAVSDYRVKYAAPSGCSFLLVCSFFFTSALPACTSESTPTITFCDTPIRQEQCTGDQTEFLTGQKLSVRLESERPFAAQQVIGKILRLTETDTIPLGSRVVTPAPNQQTIVQDLPFHEFGEQAIGTFLIEFVDENNQVIAKKELTIAHP